MDELVRMFMALSLCCKPAIVAPAAPVYDHGVLLGRRDKRLRPGGGANDFLCFEAVLVSPPKVLHFHIQCHVSAHCEVMFTWSVFRIYIMLLNNVTTHTLFNGRVLQRDMYFRSQMRSQDILKIENSGRVGQDNQLLLFYPLTSLLQCGNRCRSFARNVLWGRGCWADADHCRVWTGPGILICSTEHVCALWNPGKEIGLGAVATRVWRPRVMQNA